MDTQTVENKLTLNDLQVQLNTYGSIFTVIEYAKTFYLKYPTDKPKKPVLSHNHNSEQLKQYNSDYKSWETDTVEYSLKKSAYQERYNEVNDIIEQFLKEESGFNNIIPDDKKDKVWSKAWSDGHSSGYAEVYGCLCELVDLFS